MKQKDISAGAHSRIRLPKWQFISQGDTPAQHLFNIHLALDVGCKWVQLRLKQTADKDIIQTGLAARHLCANYNALFILNDHLKLVSATRADGVHLGLKDQTVATARNLLGNDHLIGGTANTAADLTARVKENVDYIGLGPFRFTYTKKNLSPVLGVQGYIKLLGKNGAAKKIPCPVYAIGGIGLDDLSALQLANVDGIALSGWLTGQAGLAAWEKRQKAPLSLQNYQDYYQNWKENNPAVFHWIFDQTRQIVQCLDQTDRVKSMNEN